jgi:putative restriction endonuclease
MTSAAQILDAFEHLRRAQSRGVYAPHKPLLVLLALARVQHGEPRLVAFSAVEKKLADLLTEFGPSSAAKSRHYPFWHLASDGDRTLWTLSGPAELLARQPGATPTLGELRAPTVQGGFAPEVDAALPGLLEAVAARVLETCFPSTLHADITAAVGLTLDGPAARAASESAPLPYGPSDRRRRDPDFRARVLRAYEYRCCVCGFDLRIGTVSAGLEAAHIQWHHAGGPDIEPNGLALCALHHKLFDLGAFTVDPVGHRIVFSQHAIAGNRDAHGELRHHGQPLLAPQDSDLRPAPPFLAWNLKNVFKTPARRTPTAGAGTA